MRVDAKPVHRQPVTPGRQYQGQANLGLHRGRAATNFFSNPLADSWREEKKEEGGTRVCLCQCVDGCCRAWQGVAVCCSVLQCVAQDSVCV